VLEVNPLPNAASLPLSAVSGLSRLFLDYCAGSPAARAFYAAAPEGEGWRTPPAVAAHRAELAELVAAQNPQPELAASLTALAAGAGTVLTGQQVGLFGGPLFTPFKAATALARARSATAAGSPHVGLFWLAGEDHDFDEIDHVTFPSGRALETLKYAPNEPLVAGRPVGAVRIDDSINALLDEAWRLLGDSDAMDALTEAYRPGRTFAEAFASFYARAFAAQGLLIVDAAGRAFHRLGAPVLAAAIERADELHEALLERNGALAAAGYHAQVAVGPQSSLLFLVDARSGVRQALKRLAPTVAEPQGVWQAGRQTISTGDLLGVLASEPERISPSALLRPVFQDFLFSTSLIVGGPAEVAYFAQSAVLYERILGRQTQPAARFSATLIEPAMASLLERHKLSPESLFTTTPDALAQQLAERAIPAEGRQRIAATGATLDADLSALTGWMQSLDEGLGRSAGRAASKMRYQMNRLRRLAANFELEREAALGRAAQSLTTALFPSGSLQERVHGAAFYYARHGFELSETIMLEAADAVPGHKKIFL
jgi:bacillithiol biosynthesis cysteine-adding enzyme BshC